MRPLSDKSLVLIQRYFKEELSEKDNIEFEKSLEDDDFKSELDFQATVLEGIVEARRDHLRVVFSEARKELDNSGEKNSDNFLKRNYLKIIIGLLAMILAIGAWVIGNKFNKVDHTAVFAEYYKPFDTPELTRGSVQIEESLLNSAVFLYEDEQYNEAITILNSIKPPTDNIDLLKANCYMNLSDYNKADSMLSKLLLSTDLKIKQHAEWYLALNNVKSGKIDGSKNILNSIVENENHLYFKPAQKLIKEL